MPEADVPAVVALGDAGDDDQRTQEHTPDGGRDSAERAGVEPRGGRQRETDTPEDEVVLRPREAVLRLEFEVDVEAPGAVGQFDQPVSGVVLDEAGLVQLRQVCLLEGVVHSFALL